MQYLPLLATIKYAYIKRMPYIYVKPEQSNIRVLSKLKGYGLCGHASIHESRLKVSLNYHFESPVVGQILTFSTKRHRFVMSYSALVRLTQVSPSILFILSTGRGIITHIQALKLRTGGFLIATVL